MAVQQPSYRTVFNLQKPVASITQSLYAHPHKGWMALVEIEFSLPHNPLVVGPSPACPTFIPYRLRSFFALICSDKINFFRI
jgi:hypothetical protein